MDEKAKKEEPDYGLVVIESGPFAGWLGEYDDDEGRRRIVYPLHPFNACPYALVTKIRDLTPEERKRYERGERAVIAGRSERLVAGAYDEPGWSTGESAGGMLDSVTRDVQGRRAPG
jgi:hypothetical protein